MGDDEEGKELRALCPCVYKFEAISVYYRHVLKARIARQDVSDKRASGLHPRYFRAQGIIKHESSGQHDMET